MDSLNEALEKLMNGDGPEQAKESLFENKLKKYTSGLIRTVYDFAEQQPDGIFILIDFKNNKIDAMVQVKEYLVKVSDLIEHYDGHHFRNDPQKLQEYFQNDYNEIVKLFKAHHKMIPQRMWEAMNIKDGTTKTAYGYTNMKSNADFGSTDDQIYHWAVTLSELGWQSLVVN